MDFREGGNDGVLRNHLKTLYIPEPSFPLSWESKPPFSSMAFRLFPLPLGEG